MIAFIDEHCACHGVEPICRVLPIAPSTYHAHAARRADPGKLPARAQRDITLRTEIRRVYEENFRVYGVRKIWRQLLREGTVVARCSVARLMRTMGLQGVVRGKRVRTTLSNAAAPCPLDRVNRQFKALHPNALWVSDFTYVATWAGFVYVAFVIDAFAQHIVGISGGTEGANNTRTRHRQISGLGRLNRKHWASGDGILLVESCLLGFPDPDELGKLWTERKMFVVNVQRERVVMRGDIRDMDDCARAQLPFAQLA